MTLSLGVVADDITGACDVAAGLWQAGMPVQVHLGVPDADDPPSVDAVVVALKSRTAPAAEAVADSVAAAGMLRARGAERIYQKYCSTFDSTDAGNIGPVADALLDLLGPDTLSIGTPATPAAGRTVHRGHLFVGDRLLSESSLAEHPLTPMRDPDLVRLLGRQTPRPVGLVGTEDVRSGAEAVAERIAGLRAEGARHILVDAIDEHDLDVVAAALDGIPSALVGGAAGLVSALARRRSAVVGATAEAAATGRRLVLSGSVSVRTRAQVAAFDGEVVTLEVDELAADAEAVIDRALSRIAANEPLLVTTTAEPERVAAAQARWGAATAAGLVEDALSRIAVRAVAEHGVRRLVVAGGETSGAVAAALGLGALTVRRVVAPGVPWMMATDAGGRRLDVCFKSGNFGHETLLVDAWEEG